MAQDWDIKPRGEACRKCDAPFADKQIYHSALMYGEEGYARADYCAVCWPSVEQSAMPYSVWKGVFRLPPPPPEEPLKKETAESLLRKLIQDDDDSKANVIYILAVMLERKKILIEKDVKKRPDGVWMRFYEHRKTGEVFLVTDPRLRIDQIETVQKEVMELLGATGSGGTTSPAQDVTGTAEAASPAAGA
jgi:hypothetical protein